MADIDVVPRRGGNTWMWVVLAAVVVALVLWVVARRTRTVTELYEAHPLVASAIALPAYDPLAVAVA